MEGQRRSPLLILARCALYLDLLLAGCTATPTGTYRFTLFPEGHVISPKAAAVLQKDSPLDLPRELDKRPLPPFRAEPGDVLGVECQHGARIIVVGEVPPDKLPPPPVVLPPDEPIMPDGTINLGVYGQLFVAGKTIPEIQAMIRAAVQAQTHCDPGFIRVRVTQRNSKVYYVLGEVNNPGAFPLQGRETVLDGILAAGGLHDRASRYNIILTRPTTPESCRQVLPICWYDITEVGDTSTNYQLMPGDRIYVPTRSMKDEKKAAKMRCGACDRPAHACPIPVKLPPEHPPSATPPAGPPLGH